ncbi:peroxisomal membrane protein 2-like isoform X2 [Ptychodera flava]|uniref:peroxisomal membrane protein 2-like isoform X2 n=1 Tax=Ptychodera flava TaxID=63121 RepID=UPI00396A78F6
MSSEASREKKRDQQLIETIIKAYLKQLRERPVVTKALTSATVSALGDIIAQRIIAKGKPVGIQWRSVAALASFGFVVTGPLIHHFYKVLEQVVPKNTTYPGIKKVLVDRFVLAPPYLLLFFYLVPILEGKGHDAAVKKIKDTFITALIMNWKVWTILQYININYIPMEILVKESNRVQLKY